MDPKLAAIMACATAQHTIASTGLHMSSLSYDSVTNRWTLYAHGPTLAEAAGDRVWPAGDRPRRIERDIAPDVLLVAYVSRQS
jgi:hypothetical protein